MGKSVTWGPGISFTNVGKYANIPPYATDASDLLA
jgi:hypothetical protein